jgi:tetratricopeptide (TPR) repeat protein
MNLADIYSISEATRQKALPLYHQALSTVRPLKNPILETDVLNRLSYFYDQSGEKQKAVEYTQSALALTRTIKSDEVSAAAIALTLVRLGDLHYRMADMENARTYLESALEMGKKINNLLILQYVFGVLGEVYTSKGEQAKAFENLNQGLAAARQIGDKRGEAYNLTVLGEASMLNFNASEALKFFNQAVQIADAKMEHSIKIKALAGMIRVYSFQGNKDSGVQVLKQALNIKTNDGNFEILFEVLIAGAIAINTFDTPQNAVQAFQVHLRSCFKTHNGFNRRSIRRIIAS